MPARMVTRPWTEGPGEYVLQLASLTLLHRKVNMNGAQELVSRTRAAATHAGTRAPRWVAAQF